MKQKTFFLLFMLMLIVGVSRLTPVEAASEGRSLAMIFGSSGSVLGDDDEEEEKEEKEYEKEEEKEQEKKHEEKKDEDKEEEKDDHEDENKEDEEDEEDEKYHSEEQIKNSNGTTTYIKRQEEGGKSEVELKTYDAFGKLIEERKLKQEDHDGEEGRTLELENYVYNNGDLQELKIKSKEGEEIEISIKESEATGQPSRVRYEVTEQQLKIKANDRGQELSIAPKGDYFEVSDGVFGAKVRLPLTINPDSGEVFVETVVGLVRVGISPERALEITQENDDFIYDEDEIELVEGGEGLEYRVSAQKQERLFGVFPVLIDAEYTVDAEGGEFTGTSQDFWTRVFDLMSF